jgi:hypothetical protein
VRERLPKSKPDRGSRQGDEGNANQFGPFHAVPVFFVVSAKIRLFRFRGIPLLPEFGSSSQGLFDQGRRARKIFPLVLRNAAISSMT